MSERMTLVVLPSLPKVVDRSGFTNVVVIGGAAAVDSRRHTGQHPTEEAVAEATASGVLPVFADPAYENPETRSGLPPDAIAIPATFEEVLDVLSTREALRVWVISYTGLPWNGFDREGATVLGCGCSAPPADVGAVAKLLTSPEAHEWAEARRFVHPLMEAIPRVILYHLELNIHMRPADEERLMGDLAVAAISKPSFMDAVHTYAPEFEPLVLTSASLFHAACVKVAEAHGVAVPEDVTGKELRSLIENKCNERTLASAGFDARLRALLHPR
jgi:hypothetical protein